MTWEEWINSEYNIDEYILHLSQDFGDIYEPTRVMNVVLSENSIKAVKASDLIESDHRYFLNLN